MLQGRWQASVEALARHVGGRGMLEIDQRGFREGLEASGERPAVAVRDVRKNGTH